MDYRLSIQYYRVRHRYTDENCGAVMLEVLLVIHEIAADNVDELRTAAYVELCDVVLRAVKVGQFTAVVDVQPNEIVFGAVDAEELCVHPEVQ